MFERQMRESQVNQIELDQTSDLNADAVYNLLRFLYTDKVKVDVNAALDMLPLANQYNLDRCKVPSCH